MTSCNRGNGGVRQRNWCHHRKSHELQENEKTKPEALSGKWERSHRKKKKKVALQHYSWFWANQFFRTLLNSCSMPALVSRGPRSVTSVIPTLRDFMDSSPPGSSVHGIFLARIPEWVTMPSSEIFPTQGSNLCLLHCRQILYHWAFQEASLGDHQAHNNIDIGRWSGIRSDRNVEISRSKVVGG